MAAIEQENAQRGNNSGRCAATTKAGAPCRSRPAPGDDYCLFHAEDHQEISKRGGEVSGARRSVRERFKEDAERVYPVIWESLLEAVNSEVVGWGDCPKCNHRVAVTFPDIRARTQAIQVLLDQGYGKPPLSIRQEVEIPAGSLYESLPPEAKRLYVAQIQARMSEMDALEAQTPEQEIAKLEARLAELRNGRPGEESEGS